nr:MAG TPA: hypothetical protein [Caudoviricetes sp.]
MFMIFYVFIIEWCQTGCHKKEPTLAMRVGF